MISNHIKILTIQNTFEIEILTIQTVSKNQILFNEAHFDKELYLKNIQTHRIKSSKTS